MAERSSLNQVIQIGVESTPGVAVAASKRLQSIGIEPTPSVDMDQYRPSGQKFRALTTLGKEWTTAALAGRGSFTELVYPLASVLTTPVITTPGGGVNARSWAFTPSSTNDDVPKSFTIEHGSSVRADKFSYGLVTELGMTFNRTAITVSGALMGKALTDSITLTPSPTMIDLIPVVPTQVSVYLDTTAVGLGTTKLLRAIQAEFSIGSRFGPVWVLDAANNSFVNHIETEPDLTCNLIVQADAQGMALLDAMRDGSSRFVRIEAVGGIIEGAIPFKFTLDLALKIADIGGFRDEEGVYAIEFNFVGVHDSTWNKAITATLVNNLTAL